MKTVVKRKVKLKKKNFVIFIICIFLIVLTIDKSLSFIIKTINSPKKEIKETTIKKPKVNEENKEEKEFAKIKNGIDYYNDSYKDRYIKYQEENPTLPLIQVIKDVNMNLDLTQYEDKIKAKNLNTVKILVNKYYYLEEDYVPENLKKLSTVYAISGMKLVEEAKEAFEEMSKDASEENLNIIAMSTYRSYSYQVNLYNRYKRTDGQEKADTYSGRPGHSEHQTGLAVDVYNKKENYTNFGNTKEFTWMMKHAYEYGFILRFPKDKEKETGYHYESWHYRYVGKEVATYIKEHEISFEEYYATIIKDW